MNTHPTAVLVSYPSPQARFVATHRKAAAQAHAAAHRWAQLAERFLEQGDEPRAARCILQSSAATDEAIALETAADRAQSLS